MRAAYERQRCRFDGWPEWQQATVGVSLIVFIATFSLVSVHLLVAFPSAFAAAWFGMIHFLRTEVVPSPDEPVTMAWTTEYS
jgi:hypothetical protein